MKHKHHIIPKHAGGTDDPSNIVELSIKEHADAHRILYEQHGRWQDYVAWKGLDKSINSKDIHSQATKLGMNQWWNNLTEEQRLEYKTKCSKRPDGWIAHSGHTYTHTEEAKESIRHFQKSFIKTETHKENISKNRKGKAKGDRNSMSDEENRRKVSQSKIGRKRVYMPDGSFKYLFPNQVG